MNNKSQTLARGVSSGARLREDPLLLERASGSTITTVEGEALDDFMLAMGPILLGHGHEAVIRAVEEQLTRGVLYGNTAVEHELADLITTFLPWAQHVTFVNSGSEATHLATRLGLARQGRTHILKFEGHYHGWLDPLFTNTQNNLATFDDGQPVPPQHSVAGLQAPENVIVLRWNSVEELERVFARHGAKIGAVIVEPIPLNYGTMIPSREFLQRLRELTREHAATLIFDEVLSGFRVAPGGAAELLGVQPDLGVYAKAIANGFPIAVVAGTKDAMAPITSGPMLPAGTYSGNPVSVKAALATLHELQDSGQEFYSSLEELGNRLQAGIECTARETGSPLTVNRVGSVLQLFWGVGSPVTNYQEACKSDRGKISELCNALLDGGAVVSPRGLVLLCAAHTTKQIDRLNENIARVLTAMGSTNEA